MKKELKEFIQYPEIGKVYDHYKGGRYKVMTLARHTEREESLVIYKHVGYGTVYARPLSMWFEKVQPIERDPGFSSTAKVSRFTLSKDK